MWIYEDITERKKLELDRQENEERLRRILENSPWAWSLARSKGQLVFANRQHAEMMGVPAEAVPSYNTYRSWRNPADRDTFMEQLRRDGSVKAYQADLVRTDGTPLRCCCRPCCWTSPMGATWSRGSTTLPNARSSSSALHAARSA